MKKFGLVLVLLASMVGLSSEATPGTDRKTCVFCQTDHSTGEDEKQIEIEQKLMTCMKGHSVDQEYVADIAKHHDVSQLEAYGLRCCGVNCDQKFSLAQIRELLEPVEQRALDERLAKIKASVDEIQPKTETQRLTEDLEEAFNLCCPIDGCRGTLDEIEGCNAATCPSEGCKAIFCYLCLKPQDNSLAAHAHVREHSGDYWEQRPGYADRYKWVLVRKNLAEIFKRKVPESIRNEALRARESLLRENDMWPMPAGLMSSKWVEEIKASDLSQEKKIELLQNEYIFRTQSGDSKNASVIEIELRGLGGKVLASLDVKDAHGIQVIHQQDQVNPAGNPAPQPVAVAQAVPANQGDAIITSVLLNHPDPRVAFLARGLTEEAPEFWAHGGDAGSLYLIRDPEGRVPPFVFSGVVAQNDHYQASGRCPVGSTLPNTDQVDALRRALSPNRRYNPNVIPDISGTRFWLSQVCGDDHKAYLFNGPSGLVYPSIREAIGDIRCVYAADQVGRLFR